MGNLCMCTTSPTQLELYFGWAFNFANLYSEIPIKETQDFYYILLIDMLVFGVINTSIILLILIIFIKEIFNLRE